MVEEQGAGSQFRHHELEAGEVLDEIDEGSEVHEQPIEDSSKQCHIEDDSLLDQWMALETSPLPRPLWKVLNVCPWR